MYLIQNLNECFKHHSVIPEWMDKRMNSLDLNNMDEEIIHKMVPILSRICEWLSKTQKLKRTINKFYQICKINVIDLWSNTKEWFFCEDIWKMHPTLAPVCQLQLCRKLIFASWLLNIKPPLSHILHIQSTYSQGMFPPALLTKYLFVDFWDSCYIKVTSVGYTCFQIQRSCNVSIVTWYKLHSEFSSLKRQLCFLLTTVLFARLRNGNKHIAYQLVSEENNTNILANYSATKK